MVGFMRDDGMGCRCSLIVLEECEAFVGGMSGHRPDD